MHLATYFFAPVGTFTTGKDTLYLFSLFYFSLFVTKSTIIMAYNCKILLNEKKKSWEIWNKIRNNQEPVALT